MCTGDLTIEWARVQKNGKRITVDGWGVPHQCKDPEAIWRWMKEHHGPIDRHVHMHG